MPSLAKIRLVGTTAATTFLLLSAAATSPAFAQDAGQPTGQVVNTQVQLGDVFAEQRLEVTEAEEANSVSAAQGNGLIASGDAGASVIVDSDQRVNAYVQAGSTVNVAGYAGHLTTRTAASGNSAAATAQEGGFAYGTYVQDAGSSDVLAEQTVDASTAQLNGADLSAQALANSVAVQTAGAAAETYATQTASGKTEANLLATLKYAPGTVVASASAAANQVTTDAHGEQWSGVTQTTTCCSGTYARADLSAANAWDATVGATAAGNTVSATNAYGPTKASAVQSQGGEVQATADFYGYDFGAGTATAYGVGNSMLAGGINNVDVAIDSDQANSGQVTARAGAYGTQGYDLAANATAMGNAVSGYACSDCETNARFTNRQTNDGGVMASSHVTNPGYARTVNGTANAVGNSASYSVSKPKY